ncbi:MAG TPA: DUF5615 family PIN-like protein [Candidatus Methylomirabilis sp.]
MPSANPSLYLDEDVSVVAAAILQARGFMAVTARDTGLLGRSDEAQLAFAADGGHILLSHNRVHFERLHREWLGGGRSHAGIIIARRRPPRELAARVGRLLARLPADQFKSQILYA